MLSAVIRHGEKTTITGLPRADTGLQTELLTIGVTAPARELKLFNDEKHDVEIQFGSGDRVSQHLSRLFTEEHTLADANTAAWLMQHLDESFKQEIEDNVYYDRYENLEELIEDIRIRTDQAISDGDIGMGGM